MAKRAQRPDDQAKAKSIIWRIEVEGTLVEIDLLDLDGIEWRDAKAASGLSELQILTGLDRLDIEAIAAMLWIKRRRDEPNLGYEDVLGSLSLAKLGTNVPVGDNAGEEENADPPV